jgi:hypothetical protein
MPQPQEEGGARFRMRESTFCGAQFVALFEHCRQSAFVFAVFAPFFGAFLDYYVHDGAGSPASTYCTYDSML